MAKPIGVAATKRSKLKIEKRTSIGRDQKPKNKHARKKFKRYIGQGRP